MNTDKNISKCVTCVVAGFLLASLANAQTYPVKPIRMIVPFPAGGINDVLARIAADKLQAKWGQPIIVE